MAVSCGKKKSDDAAAAVATTTTTEGEDPEEVNSLAAAFPAQLAISLFAAEDGSSLRLAEIADPNADKSLQEKIDESEAVLKGEAENCLDPSLFKDLKAPTAVTCYEFDSDMNPFTQPAAGAMVAKSFGTKDGTDGHGESCLVVFARYTATDAIQLVDKAMGLVKGMICQAKKDDPTIEIPEAGDDLDLAEAMQDAAGSKMDVTTATLEAAEGTSLLGDDVTAYTSTIEITDPKGNGLAVTLTNQTADGVDTGVLSFSRPGGILAPPGGGVDPNNMANKNEALSVKYEIDRDKHTAKIELRRAAILNTIAPFDANGLVNYTAIPEASANETSSNFNYLAFDMDTETSEGDLAYWNNPGGSYNEAARGFIFNVTNSKDVLSGCGISGADADLSIRKAITTSAEISATGWWHPQWSLNTNVDKDTRYTAQTGGSVTKQCFTRNSKGVYEIDMPSGADAVSIAHGYELVTLANSGVVAPKTSNLAPPPPPRLPPTPPK